MQVFKKQFACINEILLSEYMWAIEDAELKPSHQW
jgi:hypothetical protein